MMNACTCRCNIHKHAYAHIVICYLPYVLFIRTYTFIHSYASICSVYMFLHVSSFFFITKIIDIVKMTPLVFEHVSTLTKKNCVCVHVFSLSSYLCLSLCETPGGTYEMRTVSPPKFNMSPLKSYRNPNRERLVFHFDHFSGANCSTSGV